MNDNNLLKCAVYIRVSSDEQAKFGDSMRDQKERGIEYIDNHKNMILQDIYVDDGISGQKLDRGDFKRLIENIESNKIDLIIFTKLDRWFRNLRHYLNTQAILEEHNVAWTAIDQPYFDTSTPHGRAFVAQSMMWAELEAQNDGVRIRDVFANKVKYGEVITGKVPRGYKIENKHLVFSEEAPAIYDTIQYFIKTQSIQKTNKYMQEQYNIFMSHLNLRNSILMNSKYTGKYRDNNNYCPRMISDEDFDKIQFILSRNIKASQKYSYIFSSLLVCGECGKKMRACQINVKVTKASGKIFKYKYPGYECAYHSSYHSCPNGGEIRESKIEEYMLSNLRKIMTAEIAEYENVNIVTIDNRARKASLRKKIGRLKDLYLNEAITLDEYKIDRVRFEKELSDLSDITEPQQDFSAFKNLLSTDFEQSYIEMDNEEKRRFWRGLIKEIRVSKSEKRTRQYTIVPL